ncbi:retrovirus-related pol polyprotein from transposon TNT 1-94 [Tanacetum coccineum]
MSASNQQPLAESGATDISPILEKGNYIPWESWFRRFLENKREDGERMCKYVTLTHQNKNLSDVEYDALYDALLQFEPHVQASKAKRVAKNHDILALISHSNAYLILSKGVTKGCSRRQAHNYNGVISSSNHLEILYTTNNRLRTSSNIRNQAVIHDGRVDIQTKNAGYGRNGNKNAGRENRNQTANVGNGKVQQIDESNQIIERVPQTESNPRRENVQCYNYNARGHYACDCPKPKVHNAKYFREQMLLAMKDEAGGILNDEKNDFMLDNAYGHETFK